MPGRYLSVLSIAHAARVGTTPGRAWRFWWHGGTDRRGPSLLVGTLWVAGLAKILLR